MPRALVVFGSESGGTAGLAQMIGAALCREGWDTVVQDAGRPADVSNVDLVVIGGALYMNRWHKDARHFAGQYEPVLRTVPVWLFSSGPLDDSARSGDLAPVAQVNEIARRLEARGHMTFGGRLAEHPKGFLARSMAKKYAGDYRDPEQVSEWVAEIVHELTPTSLDVVRAAIPAQRRAGQKDTITT